MWITASKSFRLPTSPRGTGLGSSSCYVVGLLNALHSLTQTPISPGALAEEACHIELDRLQKPIGKQDQYMAAFGGLTSLEISKEGEVKATRLCLSVELLEVLESSILLFYTGAREMPAAFSRSKTQRPGRSPAGVLASLCEIRGYWHSKSRCDCKRELAALR